MANRNTRVLIPILAVCLLSVGCASGRIRQINRRLTSLEAVSKRPPDAAYTVDPPDVIRVEFFNQPELSRQVQLRSDGAVTLPLVEDVPVAGLTTRQIREKLEKLYVTFFREPKILVTVTAYNSKHVYVYGEVGRKGLIPYTGHTTVADAIGTMGGVTRRAATRRVKVIRGDPHQPEIFKVNLSKLVFKGDVRQDVSLAENDVVYVPPNVLAWVGYQIDNLLFPFRGIFSLLATGRAVTE